MLADAIESLGALTYAVRARASNGFDTHGRAVAPTITTGINIVGLLLPMTSREIERLPEGLHQKEVRAFYTRGSLSVPDSDAGTVGDHIVEGGHEWEVVSIQDYSAIASYNCYVMSRVDP